MIAVVSGPLILLILKDVLEKRQSHIVTTGKLSWLRCWILWGPSFKKKTTVVLVTQYSGFFLKYLSEHFSGTSLMGHMVKNLPAMRGTQVRSLGWEDSLETRMATHSSILAWRIPWTEEPGGLQSMGSLRVSQDWAAVTFQN